MTEQRIIKKYPNRRLYDTAISSYITLEDVRRLVLEQVPLMVIDARTQSDITHNTLLQIIIEQEEKGTPLFSNDMLQHMIRFYAGGAHDLFKQMFDQGVALFNGYISNQADNKLTEADHSTTEVSQQWEDFQSAWFKRFEQLALTAETAPEETTEASVASATDAVQETLDSSEVS